MTSDSVFTEGRASARPIVSKRDTRTRVLPVRNRKRPIHLAPAEKHNRAIIIYVTACRERRRAILASPQVHAAIVGAWRNASTWLVDRYVVMPDHVHFFCTPDGMDAPSLEHWMQFWKATVTKSIGAKKGERWQREHWDRQLRSLESYASKWEYVRRNPARYGLCEHPDDWPSQGELNILQW
jgi:putative transposase